jgi:hypothetical protein
MLKAQALPSLAKLPENPVSGITPWFIGSLGIVFFSYTLEVKNEDDLSSFVLSGASLPTPLRYPP